MLLPCSRLYVCLPPMWLHTHHVHPTPPESTPTRLSHWSQMEKSSVRARQLLSIRLFFILHFKGVILVTPVGGRNTWGPSTSRKWEIRESYLLHPHLPCSSVCVCVVRGEKAELCVLYLNGFVEKPARPLAAEGGGACGVWESRQRRHKHTDTGSLEPGEKRQTWARIPGTAFLAFFFSEGEKLRRRRAHVFVSCAHWCVRDVCVGTAAPTRCCVDD